jgi:peptidoglycan hydrolase-like protein with peptidoglycan-binding domain
MKGLDVKLLQQFLNTHGFPVSKKGIGSKGRENTTFGPATKAALVRFQKANKIPATGFFGVKTRGAIMNR